MPPAASTSSAEKLAPVRRITRLRTTNSTVRVGFRKTDTHNSLRSIRSGVLFVSSQITRMPAGHDGPGCRPGTGRRWPQPASTGCGRWARRRSSAAPGQVLLDEDEQHPDVDTVQSGLCPLQGPLTPNHDPVLRELHDRVDRVPRTIKQIPLPLGRAVLHVQGRKQPAPPQTGGSEPLLGVAGGPAETAAIWPGRRHPDLLVENWSKTRNQPQ
jgi:hypothetical protein